MLDIRMIREDPQGVVARLASRGQGHNLAAFQTQEANKRTLQAEVEGLQARRNEISKEVGRRKGAGQPADDLLGEMQALGPRLKSLEVALKEQDEAVLRVLEALPNLPQPEVPVGGGEEDNVELRRWGAPRAFDFTPLSHWELGERLGILDFAAGAKLSGARFTVFRGLGAQLSRALANFMLDLHTREHGYSEVLPPMLVNAASLYGTGQLPKFGEDLYQTKGESEDGALYLIPTAEVPLTNLVRESILEEQALPLRLTAWTGCFRREAGAAGKDTRGLIRQHQFDKVEMVQIVKPEESNQALEELTRHAETVLQRLELPYRVIVLCTGDMGFSSARTHDLEVWLPGQNRYREISSCSNCEGFQARRMQARLKRGGKTEPVHTLNGSGLAVGRTLVAVLENYQQADGSVTIPDALRPYLGGIARIG